MIPGFITCVWQAVLSLWSETCQPDNQGLTHSCQLGDTSQASRAVLQPRAGELVKEREKREREREKRERGKE